MLLDPHPKTCSLWDERKRVVYRPIGAYVAKNRASDPGLTLHAEFETMSAETGAATLKTGGVFATASAQWAFNRWVQNSRLTVLDGDEAIRLWGEYEAAARGRG